MAGVHCGTSGVGPTEHVLLQASPPNRPWGDGFASSEWPGGSGGSNGGAAGGDAPGSARSELRVEAGHVGGPRWPERQRQKHPGAAGGGGVVRRRRAWCGLTERPSATGRRRADSDTSAICRRRSSCSKGSVAENVARLEEPDDEAVIAAARAAHCHEMIMRLPGNYDAAVAPGGANL